MSWRELPLPFPKTHARTEDPDTSKAAARQVSRRQRQAMRARLLDAFRCSPWGLSAEQAAAAAGYTADDGAWKRVSDLERDGLVEDSGTRVQGSHGRQVRVLVITEAGWRNR